MNISFEDLKLKENNKVTVKGICMHYDPVKDRIFKIVNSYPILMKAFFFLLDMLFLRQWYVKKAILDSIRKNDKIHFYDAGAGFCQYSDYILSGFKKANVFALDLKSNYLSSYSDYAAKRFPNRFKWETGDLVTYHSENNFDLILAIDILEHIENDRQVLANFFTCLRKGGKLIISTPSDKDETARYTEEHVRPGYAEDEIKEKLVSAGFKIHKFKYSYGKKGNLAWKLAINYPLEMLSHYKFIYLLLPIYYICLYPLIYILMLVDIRGNNKIGNGIIIIAEKAS